MHVRSLHVLALITLLAGTACASSFPLPVLTLNDLTLLNAQTNSYQLTAAAGQQVEIDATISLNPATPSLVLGDIQIDQSTTEGDAVTVDPTVYYFGNFYSAEENGGDMPLISGTNTVGGLMTIDLPQNAPGISTVAFSIEYEEQTSPISVGYFNGSIEVDTVSNVPEPAYTNLIWIALVVGFYYRKRQSYA